jgi:hypothetical protein
MENRHNRERDASPTQRRTDVKRERRKKKEILRYKLRMVNKYTRAERIQRKRFLLSPFISDQN